MVKTHGSARVMNRRDKLESATRRCLRAASIVGLGSVVAGVVVSGCKPDIGARASLVSETRVLAIRALPAEAKPGEPVTFEALVATVANKSIDTSIDWALCNERKPLTEQGAVATGCLVRASDALDPIGSGRTAQGELPLEACRQFGPDTPEPKPGEAPGRPVDPDATGGYYQPVRLLYELDGSVSYATGEVRLQCGLAGATGAQLNEYNAKYRPNVNPDVAKLSVVRATGTTPIADGASIKVGAGEHVTFEVGWVACPATATCGDNVCSPEETAASCESDCTTPMGCTGAERFAQQDPSSRQIVLSRESISVSWFATGGELDEDRTGRSSDDPTTSSANGWTAPNAGQTTLWVVLRDNRGGVGWRSFVATAGN